MRSKRASTSAFSSRPPKSSLLRRQSSSSPKKTKARRRSRPLPPPAPIILPPHERRPRTEFTSDRPGWITAEQIGAVALNVARANSWRERKQHMLPLKAVFLTYQDLSLVIHRLPSFDERLRATEMLKDRVRDSDHSFYVFVQSFALNEERRQICAIFQLPLMN
jgi:hypothetical protein